MSSFGARAIYATIARSADYQFGINIEEIWLVSQSVMHLLRISNGKTPSPGEEGLSPQTL